MTEKKGSAFSAFAPASAERLPDTAEGKTSKHKSKHASDYGGMYTGAVNMALLPSTGNERIYRSLKLPELAQDTTVYAELDGKPSNGYRCRKIALSAQVSAPVVQKEVTSQASSIAEIRFNKETRKEEYFRVSPSIVPGDKYLHVVSGIRENRVTTIQKADSFHAPILSARSAQEAKFYASMLKKPDVLTYIRKVNSIGYTVREMYADSIGVDIDKLRQRGAAYERKALFGAAFLTTEEYTRRCQAWYNAELERKIAIAESPAMRAERKRADRRKVRRSANEQNRDRNRAAYDDSTYRNRRNAEIVEKRKLKFADRP